MAALGGRDHTPRPLPEQIEEIRRGLDQRDAKMIRAVLRRGLLPRAAVVPGGMQMLRQ